MYSLSICKLFCSHFRKNYVLQFMYFYNEYADTYFARFRTKYPQRKKAAALTRPAPLVTHICVIFVFDKRRSPEAAP